MVKDDILLDFSLRFIIDDVSPEDKPRTEFRASVYDGDNELLIECWSSTISKVTKLAMKKARKEIV